MNYVTSKNIERKAERWLDSLPHRGRWPADIRFEDSALLVIDMQKYFLSPESHAYLPAGETMIEGINDLIAFFSKNDAEIVYTRTVQEEGDEGVMGEWWDDIIREGELAELHNRIEVKGETIVKPRYSAFYRTNLEERLQGIKNIFITGVMTDLCCETTARDAFVRDYRVFFLADATATSSEEMHTASLKSICHGIGEVLSCREAKERLR